MWFQTVVPVGVIGQRRGDILGWLVQPPVAFLGETPLTCSSVLLYLGPQRLIGRPNLTGNIAGHLGRQMIHSTHFCIRLLL